MSRCSKDVRTQKKYRSRLRVRGDEHSPWREASVFLPFGVFQQDMKSPTGRFGTDILKDDDFMVTNSRGSLQVLVIIKHTTSQM